MPSLPRVAPADGLSSEEAHELCPGIPGRRRGAHLANAEGGTAWPKGAEPWLLPMSGHTFVSPTLFLSLFGRRRGSSAAASSSWPLPPRKRPTDRWAVLRPYWQRLSDTCMIKTSRLGHWSCCCLRKRPRAYSSLLRMRRRPPLPVGADEWNGERGENATRRGCHTVDCSRLLRRGRPTGAHGPLKLLLEDDLGRVQLLVEPLLGEFRGLANLKLWAVREEGRASGARVGGKGGRKGAGRTTHLLLNGYFQVVLHDVNERALAGGVHHALLADGRRMGAGGAR